MKAKILMMDVDGTLTDGKIYMGQTGEIMKAFSDKDGYGLMNALKHGLVPAIVTGRSSDIVVNRFGTELKVQEIYQGVTDKTAVAVALAEKYDLTLRDCAYIGNDLNDLEVMLAVKDAGGLCGCPADSVDRIKDISDFVSPNAGGSGAVRTFIDWLLKD